MILITGANGFLGNYLVGQLLDHGFSALATGKGPCRLPYTGHQNFLYAEMDFTDPFSVHDVFEQYQPAIVVHAGAMSKPDDCELNQWLCYSTNVEGTLTLVSNAEELDSFFIFISTDFVFSGEAGGYREEDPSAPVNFYGRSKQEAEEIVKEYPGHWSIVRTCLVYGKPATGKQNLLTVVRDRLAEGDIYKVFNDQVRTPTYVEDLAKGIVSIIQKKAPGIFHLAGRDLLTPFEMATRTATHLQLDQTKLVKAVATDFAQPAKRPAITGLNIDKAIKELGFDPISFKEGLQRTFE